MSAGDIRYDDGPIMELARADGWVMVRRPGCIPYCKRASEWERLTTFSKRLDSAGPREQSPIPAR